MQHTARPRVEDVKFTPEALLVLDTLHEAARDVVASLEDECSREENKLAALKWPAIV